MMFVGKANNVYAMKQSSLEGVHDEIIAVMKKQFKNTSISRWSSNFRLLAEYFVTIEWYTEAMTCYCLSEQFGDENDSELAEHAISRLERELDCEIIPLSIDEVRDLADFFCFPF